MVLKRLKETGGKNVKGTPFWIAVIGLTSTTMPAPSPVLVFPTIVEFSTVKLLSTAKMAPPSSWPLSAAMQLESHVAGSVAPFPRMTEFLKKVEF